MICIIPARGDSKRLPGKNIRELDGVPIINRVIQIARDSKLFTNIIVSTDSKNIADIVRPFADVHIRPMELSGDIAEDRVLKYAMSYNVSFCRIYPFSALLTPERLCAGYKEFLTGKYENVHECQEYVHPIDRAVHIENGYYWPEMVSVPTEELYKSYHEAGTYMFTTLKALDKPLAERKIKWMTITEMEAQDIDDEADWEMLEAKWGYKYCTDD